MNEGMIAAISKDYPKLDKDWLDSIANVTKFISKIIKEEALYEDKTVRWEGPMFLDPQTDTLCAVASIAGIYSEDEIRRIAQVCSGCAVAIDIDLNLEMHDIIKAAIKQRAIQKREKSMAMVNLSVRIEADVFKQLTDMADSDKRSVSYVSRELIIAALKLEK